MIVIKADKPLNEGQPFFSIRGFKDEFSIDLPPIQPTPESICNGHLEFVIIDTPYNRSVVARHYAHYSKLAEPSPRFVKVEEETVIPVEEKEPEEVENREGIILDDDDIKFEDIESEDQPEEKIEAKVSVKKISPLERKKHKDEAKAKLAEKGIPFPEKATLVELQELLVKNG